MAVLLWLSAAGGFQGETKNTASHRSVEPESCVYAAKPTAESPDPGLELHEGCAISGGPGTRPGCRQDLGRSRAVAPRARLRSRTGAYPGTPAPPGFPRSTPQSGPPPGTRARGRSPGPGPGHGALGVVLARGSCDQRSPRHRGRPPDSCSSDNEQVDPPSVRSSSRGAADLTELRAARSARRPRSRRASPPSAAAPRPRSGRGDSHRGR